LIGQNKVLLINFSVLGIQTVYLYCKDNDGFVSDTQKLIVMVSAKKPYFVKSKIDTTIFINDSLRLSVPAKSDNPSAPIIAYDWDFNNTNTWAKTTATSQLDTTFTNAVTVIVRVRCRNVYSTSETALVTITVTDGKPVVNSVVPESTTIVNGEPVSIRVKATDYNGTCQKLAVRFTTSSTDSLITLKPLKVIDTLISLICRTKGKYAIAVAVIDNDGKYSEYTTSDSITVVPFLPSITPRETWINDSTLYIVSATGNKTGIIGRSVSWDNGSTWVTNPDSIFRFAYTSAGKKYIKAVIKDKNGVVSDTLRDCINVNEGRPGAGSFAINSSVATDTTVWIRSNKNFTIRGTDVNGTIKQWAVKWETGQSYTVQNDSVFTYSFSAPGTYTLSYYVVDDDNVFSDTLQRAITVKDRKPSVLSITPDTSINSIYINDARKFTITWKDTVGVVDSLKIDNGSGVYGAFYHVTGNSFNLDRHFTLQDSGSRTIRAMVKDTDGLVSDEKVLTFNVLIGRPIITALTIDTTAGSVFVKDARKYTISFNDMNGSIRKVYASLNGGLSWDSVTVNITGAGTESFEYNFDTLGFGSRTLRFRVRDEDTVFSASKDTAITVRLGAPLIYAQGLTKDTIWVPVDSGVGRSYPIRILHSDTNGMITNFFWNEAGPTLGRMTATDTIMRNIGLNDINASFPMWIYGRDDDGLTRGGRFMVFADSAPPNITVYALPNADSITIYWSGKDTRDGNQTEYLILLRENTNPDTSRAEDILSNWKTGHRVSDDISYDFMYRFKMVDNVPNKVFRYRVLARDKRLAISQSDIANFPY
jgi:hypothetical protein